MKNKLSIVIPIFNEAEGIYPHISKLVQYIDEISDWKIDILLVDDGSKDTTVIEAKRLIKTYDQIELLCLTRNFGKEAAMFAGLQQAVSNTPDAVIVMDSDLQHPPSLIPKMLNLWKQGIDVVEAYKTTRGDEGKLSHIFANSFYSLFHFLSKIELQNHSDFKLLDIKVVHAYLNLPERERFFRGLISWMGFSSAKIPFTVEPRLHGTSSWSITGLIKLSITAITSFSTAPLHIITGLGITFIILSVITGGIALYDKFMGIALSGFTTVILLLLLIGGFLMLGLGMLGVYVAHIYNEVKQRPHYLLNKKDTILKEKKGKT
ncbi:glycosyltransferase family 2 protein [Candidatus Venteria ishoeyi]|uniref:glycosyltransferase family 2 protein n=2 Tax=Candidatus Venteria ishoeyi TaxID=1899563 RepID=UPI0025A5B4E4|nr:glycosyltransferase family 2 protein [Candidatus Venteria ishoeyi]MDM8547050.1 glycosyltransferase family 2 protein [Candidatus Venteria ishoeyi]